MLIAIPVLFGITVINFAIVHMAPGSPVDMFLDPNTPKELLEIKKEALGLDSPLYVQYFNWIGNMLQGNLGYSFSSFAPVSQLIGERLGATMLLAFSALFIAFLIAIPFGVYSVVKVNTKIDYALTGLSFVGISIPKFFLGLGFIYLFAMQWNLLPTGGMRTLNGGGGFVDTAIHLILPVAVLVLTVVGKKIRYVRASMLDVLKQDYLKTARAKGVKEFLVTNKHALRNAMIPILTVFGLEVPLLLGGSIIIEQIFQWPGIGQLTMSSILSRDYPVLMALNLVAAVIVLLTNLVTDIMYSVVDPRVKFS